jgi:biotin carboxyl carrier protein
VLVAVGDTVTSGQGIIVMESMKMEQTIAAATDGTVAKILVAPGDAVAHGQSMVELG